jgi:hypothetical protein
VTGLDAAVFPQCLFYCLRPAKVSVDLRREDADGFDSPKGVVDAHLAALRTDRHPECHREAGVRAIAAGCCPSATLSEPWLGLFDVGWKQKGLGKGVSRLTTTNAGFLGLWVEVSRRTCDSYHDRASGVLTRRKDDVTSSNTSGLRRGATGQS